MDNLKDLKIGQSLVIAKTSSKQRNDEEDFFNNPELFRSQHPNALLRDAIHKKPKHRHPELLDRTEQSLNKHNYSDWFASMSPEEQAYYLKLHPKSKLAKGK